jgi:hypothetical protein
LIKSYAYTLAGLMLVVSPVKTKGSFIPNVFRVTGWTFYSRISIGLVYPYLICTIS